MRSTSYQSGIQALQAPFELVALNHRTGSRVSKCSAPKLHAVLCLYSQRPSPQLYTLKAHESLPWPPPRLALLTPVTKIFAAQASALLLVHTKKARYAISFGNAWQWVDESAVERRFGLLAALNCIDDDQIKVVDAQQIDSLALARRAQVSHSSEISAFGLDVRRDLMRAIVGRPKSIDIGTNIMGADAARIVCKIDFEEIGTKCDQLLLLSNDKKYQANYPWVDNIEIVKNPQLRDEFDKILLSRINNKNTDGIYLSSPRIRDLSIDEEYRFHFDDDDLRRFDIEFEEFAAGIVNELPIALPFLKKKKIEIYAGAAAAPIDKFSVYSGIVFETSHGNALCCLIDGEWYKVSKTHAEFVADRIKKLARSQLKFPDAKKSEKEGDYNIRAAAHLKALCLDKQLVMYGGGNNKVELCDILTSPPCFVHVKKAGDSQVLSHLFNQGVVAGQFLLEEEFRTIAKGKTPAAYHAMFASPFAPETVGITFAVISEKATKVPENLPFFSKQTLINTSDLLGKFKYQVSIAGIGIS